MIRITPITMVYSGNAEYDGRLSLVNTLLFTRNPCSVCSELKMHGDLLNHNTWGFRWGTDWKRKLWETPWKTRGKPWKINKIINIEAANRNSKNLPTCQVRVVRFYHSCSGSSLSSSSSSSSFSSTTSASTSTSTSALPTLRQSLRQLPRAVGTAGPQPGTFRAQWAPLDLSGQMECQNIFQIDCQNICHIECQNICEKECHIECQNICQIERQNIYQIKCWKICQIEWQKVCQKICRIEYQKEDLPDKQPEDSDTECQKILQIDKIMSNRILVDHSKECHLRFFAADRLATSQTQIKRNGLLAKGVAGICVILTMICHGGGHSKSSNYV